MKNLYTPIIVLAVLGTGAAFVQEWKSGIVWPEPPVIDPGSDQAPPSDAIVLFDGTSLDAWNGGDKWDVKDGYAISKGGNIKTKDSFGDIQLHLEWAAPEQVRGSGQGRGNSGVYLMDKYEVQILDSYENETYFDGQAGAIYKQNPPMVNASRPPGEWQTYDILWTCPKFAKDGTLTSPATITVLHNGIVVQNHYELQGTTHWHQPPQIKQHKPTGPIRLQFHGNPVRFRNIWVRKLEPLVGKLPQDKTEQADLKPLRAPGP